MGRYKKKDLETSVPKVISFPKRLLWRHSRKHRGACERLSTGRIGSWGQTL